MNDTIKHRISLQAHKEKVLHLYHETQKLLQDDNLDPHQKLILERAETILEHEIQKLEALRQVQYISVSEQLEKIQETIASLKKRSRTNKKQNVFVPLRDPVLSDTFHKIMDCMLFSRKRQSILSFSQFRIAFLVLYLTGARVNEIKHLTKKDFNTIEKTGSYSRHKNK